jgi:hypothetical protein
MSNMVHLLWFVNEMAEHDDAELLIGVYSDEAEARAAIQRLKRPEGLCRLSRRLPDSRL